MSHDPEFMEMLAGFTAELTRRAQRLDECAQTRDWPGLKRLAHQLKGLAASYGFPQITRVAGALEAAIAKQNPAEGILDLAGELVGLCRAAGT